MTGDEITAELVSELVASQFPEWSDLQISPVKLPGWDNVTFRLGDELTVRLPRENVYAPQVAKEHQWLPVLARQLPFAIPEPVAIGEETAAFPRAWSIYRWIEGESAATATVSDEAQLARDLGGFLTALRRIDADDGPPAGPHNFHRGGRLSTYDDQTRPAIAKLANDLPGSQLIEIWDAALASSWTGPPVWVHGDITPSNLLIVDGALGAVIDFGCAAVGDPACDLVMAWTYFSEDAREEFEQEAGLDDDTWARALGWALWKALVTLTDDLNGRRPAVRATAAFGWRAEPRRIVDRLVEHHRERRS